MVESASPPRRRGTLWSGFQEAETRSFKTEMFLPVPPEADRGRPWGWQAELGWLKRWGVVRSPEVFLHHLSETLLPDSGGGFAALAVLLLLPFLGFLQDRQGDGPWGEAAGTLPC